MREERRTRDPEAEEEERLLKEGEELLREGWKWIPRECRWEALV